MDRIESVSILSCILYPVSYILYPASYPILSSVNFMDSGTVYTSGKAWHITDKSCNECKTLQDNTTPVEQQAHSRTIHALTTTNHLSTFKNRSSLLHKYTKRCKIILLM